ncbi:MAG TPA: hypothetical protein VJH03_20810 [Blastocatellia bacterium]|nr:hypothetical protein [Blastocatellia bacterium]
MNTTGLKNKMSSGLMVIALVLGTGIATHARDDNRNGGRWDKEHTREYGYVFAYHNAYTDGERSLGNGYRINCKDTPGYRNDTSGWRDWMGYRDDYRDSYRRGFTVGFNDGQNRRSRRYSRRDVDRLFGDNRGNVYGRGGNPDDGGYNRGRGDHGDRDRGYGRDDRNRTYQIALRNGYRDGHHHGEEDRKHRRRYNYEHSDGYRSGLGSYHPFFGDRYTYQRGFREGYRRGYDDGYRGYGNRGRSGFQWPF